MDATHDATHDAARDRANSLSSDDDVAAELSQRAAIIARKVWFLRHAQSCRDPSRCPLAPCKQAFLLLAHMRACGAFQDPERGCRAPACRRAARLLHHPRNCRRASCEVCAKVRAAGPMGAGLVVPKDLVQAADVCPPCTPPRARPQHLAAVVEEESSPLKITPPSPPSINQEA